MTTESTPKPLGPILDRNGKPLERAKSEGEHLLACASDRIRENPVPMVLGAFGLGIAVGCLIMSSRHESPAEILVTGPANQAAEAIGETLNRLYANLKFW